MIPFSRKRPETTTIIIPNNSQNNLFRLVFGGFELIYLNGAPGSCTAHEITGWN